MSEEQRIAMATALQDLKEIIADWLTAPVADMQAELIRIEQDFAGKMAIIEKIQIAAMIFAVVALVMVIVITFNAAWTEAKKAVGKHTAGGERK